MTAFVLVHGAWHGGWCYKRVARLLRRAGHEVYTPTLTGLGERAHLMNRTIDLDTHVQDIVGVIRCEELSDVVLCGHSYGGMVITGVADQLAAKTARSSISTPSCPKTASRCSIICRPSSRKTCVPTPRRTAKVTRSRPSRRLRSPSTPRTPPGWMQCASSSRWRHSSSSHSVASRCRSACTFLPTVGDRRRSSNSVRASRTIGLAVRQPRLRSRRDVGPAAGARRRAHRRCLKKMLICTATINGRWDISREFPQRSSLLPYRVCYPFARKHGRDQAVKRRELITLLGGAAARVAARGALRSNALECGILACSCRWLRTTANRRPATRRLLQNAATRLN